MDHESKTTHECETPVVQEGTMETRDRWLFDFMGKKKEEEGETKQEEVMAAEFQEKVKVEECVVEEEDKEKEKKHGHLKELYRSIIGSSSLSIISSSSSHKEDTTVPMEKCDEPGVPADEKKGFLDMRKEKLPGGHKEADEVSSPPPPPPPAECAPVEPPCQDGSPKEKKGLLEKIKEKLPGYHPRGDEEMEKEKKKDLNCDDTVNSINYK
ncbi:hypothetical protein EUGRSUZ_F01726 [Eucalyptus grandis]|uniref:Uncharacterized protein n=2 Tax=Eucalyptus grandis TaxID=71139 RepID=A0ACC3KF61_EUCGR|nr:hypothetical protein EUGRSUZ_F01726 [Eucalyptus grandis]